MQRISFHVVCVYKTTFGLAMPDIPVAMSVVHCILMKYAVPTVMHVVYEFYLFEVNVVRGVTDVRNKDIDRSHIFLFHIITKAPFSFGTPI